MQSFKGNQSDLISPIPPTADRLEQFTANDFLQLAVESGIEEGDSVSDSFSWHRVQEAGKIAGLSEIRSMQTLT